MIITEIYCDGSEQKFEGDVIRENRDIVVIQTKDGIREIPKKRLSSDFKIPAKPPVSRTILT